MRLFPIAPDPVASQVEVTPSSGASVDETPLIVTYTGDGDVFADGALDVPGATVEIVETDLYPVSTSLASKQHKKGAPVYRHGLLLK